MLQKIPDDVITVKFTNGKTKLISDLVSTFRGSQQAFYENKYKFHAFFLLKGRFLKVLLYGIPSSFSKQAVKGELIYQGFPATHVRKFDKNGGTYLCLW